MTGTQHRTLTAIGSLGMTLAAFFAQQPVVALAQPAAQALDRTVLPIPEPKRQTFTELDVRSATAPPRFAVTPVAGAEKLKAGKYTLRFEFAYDGGGFGKGGMGTLYVNDKKVGEGRIGRTQPMIFSADETADVGIDLATPVVEAIGSEAKSRFNGRIPKVTVEVKAAKPAEKAEADAATLLADKKALAD